MSWKFGPPLKGPLAGEVDVIGNGHPFAWLVVGIERASGICEHERFHATFIHEADAFGGGACGVAFVKVVPPAGDEDIFIGELGEEKRAIVAGHG